MGIVAYERIKVDVPKSNIARIWISTFEWYVVGADFFGVKQTHTPSNKTKQNIGAYTCSRYANRYKLGELYDH